MESSVTEEKLLSYIADDETSPAIEAPAVEPDAVLVEANNQLDDLEIQVEAREWKVEGKITVRNPRTQQDEEREFSRSYMQKPLSYTAMLQFTALVGERISQAMGEGVTLDSILGDVSGIAGAIRGGTSGGLFDGGENGYAGIDSFVSGIAKLATHLPTIVEDCQCIWLRVPLQERFIVKEIWGYSPEDGGLSMQDGEEMMSLFIAQNYQELKDFFIVRLRRVLATATAINKKKSTLEDADQQHLKPSNIIPVTTPSP